MGAALLTFSEDHVRTVVQEMIDLDRQDDEAWRAVGMSGHIDRWTLDDLGRVPALIDDIARYIAIEYYNKRISFWDADFVANALWSFIILSDKYIASDILFNVFSAFDSGEYHRKEDLSDDPVATYTDPEIERIVKYVLKV